jgi:hypothetical protein
MTRLGRYLGLLGLVLIGVTAVMRRIMKPEDWDNIGLHRSTVLVPMLLGAALLIAAIVIESRSKRRSKTESE